MQGYDSRGKILAVLALITGGTAPIFTLLLSAGYAQWVLGLTKNPQMMAAMHSFASRYVPLVLLPSLLILLGIAVYSRSRYPGLHRRIVVGFTAGAVATVALDFFRMLGVLHQWLPVDTTMMFGKLILGMEAPFGAVLAVGFLYHFLNGANFGLFYTMVFGRVRWYWAVVWLLVVEVGMMTLPPMAPLVGPFGVRYLWPHLFAITLAAHVAFGVVLGLLVEHWGVEKGTLFDLLSRSKDEGKRRGRRGFETLFEESQTGKA
jgi:hypothetical protein